MYTATVLVQVVSFVPASSGGTIKALMGPPTDTSPGAPTGVFSGTGKKIVVTVPAGYTGSVQLTLQLPDPNYCLLGVAGASANGGVGRTEFPSVVIFRDSYGSQLTVVDECLPEFDNATFSYDILIQQVTTGQFGYIDPDEENVPS
ncbi:MAG: hypothetical protein HY302_04230 [Opitutae bacterium]|nr:hypothetical protein [Opitutae bacterium]